MGTYVNPGNAAFREALNSRIYIDKTKLILYTNSILNTTQKQNTRLFMPTDKIIIPP